MLTNVPQYIIAFSHCSFKILFVTLYSPALTAEGIKICKALFVGTLLNILSYYVFSLKE